MEAYVDASERAADAIEQRLLPALEALARRMDASPPEGAGNGQSSWADPPATQQKP